MSRLDAVHSLSLIFDWSQAQVFKNAYAVLIASSSSPSHVLKSTVFLKSMNDFAAFNKLYAEFFGESKPARSCVEVARLPRDVLVEMEYVEISVRWEMT